MGLNRRDLFKAAGVGIVAASLETGFSNKVFASHVSDEELKFQKPSPNSPRVVIVGAGWSGLTIAKYIKTQDSNIDVVLVDKRSEFFSCPTSNLWLVDLLPFDFLIHDFLKPADKYGYHFCNATVYDVDREKRRVYTDKGYLSYDILVLAPGIAYEYSEWIKDPKDVEIARKRYPAAFIPGSEHLALKRKIQEFEEGTFALTVPPGMDYRCLPGPYERAALIAWYFKENKIKGKVVLVDPHAQAPVKAKLFQSAYDKLKDYIEYYPNTTVKAVDVNKKKIITEQWGDLDFTNGSIYPTCKAAGIVYKAGLVKKGEKWPSIDPLKYHFMGDERVYVTGDARNQPFSKSGNTSNSEGHYIAKLIVAKLNGKDIPWQSPETLCYSAVEKEKAGWIDVKYAYDPQKGFSFADPKVDENATESNYKAYIEWAKGLFRDMFG